MATGVEERVVELSDNSIKPVPLPNGESLLFVRIASRVPASLAEIWEANLNEKTFRRLTWNTVYDGSMSSFQDCRRVVFCRDACETYIMDLETLKCEFVCDGSHPVLSEDELSVYVVRQRKPSYQYDVWKHEFLTGTERVFPFDGSIIQSTCGLSQGRIAVICDATHDNVGMPAILDPTTGKWQGLPRLLELAGGKKGINNE